ncbi:MAG TPA: ABC transporter ATP-binding protein [Myxococcales bacterium]|nr:ABC transporter ATP-binding protein [Myxococcales bacterium]
MNALELSGIVKRFDGAAALDGVSLAVAPGEVLALVGENGAGKSTLVSVACGLYRADAGEVRAFGQELPKGDPRAAIAAGIGVVYQHFMLVGPLTVWENVVLGREPQRLGFVDRARARREVTEAAARFGLSLDADARVESLGVAAQQRVEIVKQLWRGARVLILDEPTAVLSPREAEDLVSTARALAAGGRAVVFISHKLREVLAVADRIAVLRRGKLVEVLPRTGADAGRLAESVMGSAAVASETAAAIPGGPRPRPTPIISQGSDILLRVDHLSCASSRGRPALRDLSFQIAGGEILGVAGVDGNGQAELAEALTGLRPATGEASLAGDATFHRSAASARKAGVAHLPEDRRARGLCLPLSVEENLALGHHQAPPWSRGALIDVAGRRRRARELIAAFDIRPADPLARAGDLSGGNQQKLVVARELAGGPAPRLVVAVHPTRGLDVGATRRVHQALRAAREGGAAVLVVSLDLDELRTLSDRILVLFGGRSMGEAPAGAGDEVLGRMMLGEEVAHA